jgi:uncharacterized surface protein with fasciclin (FAS1) repeats
MIARRPLLGATAALTALPWIARAQPAPTRDLLQTLAAEPQFSRFLALCQRSGLAARLAGNAPLTVFAPTDAAFDRMPVNVLNDLVGDNRNSPDPVRLPALVSHHLMAGAAPLAALRGQVADQPSLNGGLLRLDGRGEGVTVAVAQPAGGPASNFGTGVGGLNLQSPARVLRADILASNGIVHAIDKVLLP